MPIVLSDLLNGLALGFLLLVMLVGLFGMLVPIFPGGIVIWLACLAYGIGVGFEGIGIWLIALITVLMIAGGVGDNIVMGKAARDKGASWTAITLGLIAGIFGTLIFPPFGGVIAAPAVLYLVELIRTKDTKNAAMITRGLIIGWGWSLLLRFGLGLGMILVWIYWVWTNVV